MSNPPTPTTTNDGDFHFHSTVAQPASSGAVVEVAHSSSPSETHHHTDPSAEAQQQQQQQQQHSQVEEQDDDDQAPTSLYSPALSQPQPQPQQNETRPPPPSHSSSFNLDPFGSHTAITGRRVSYPVTSSSGAGAPGDDSTIWSSPSSSSGPAGAAGQQQQQQQQQQRTLRAASDGLLLSTGFSGAFGGGPSASRREREREQSSQSSAASNSGGSGGGGGGEYTTTTTTSAQQDPTALFREHERRSLENSASAHATRQIFGGGGSASSVASPPLTSGPTTTTPGATSSFFPSQPQPLLSPSLTLPPASSSAPATPSLPQQPSSASSSSEAQTPAGRAPTSASLHLGDLDVWMDEAYVRECCARMGWDGVVNVKMIRGASPSSGYCFLTFPSTSHASAILSRFNASPPTLMPRSSRTFKLNWGTGLPGLQPRWEGEYSVFVGDLGREVGEAELVSLFTPIFPSTKSAKVMCDPSTGLSRGYGFVRFCDEGDMHRALALGQHAGSGLSLHGRTLRISEASGPGNSLAGGADGSRRSNREGQQQALSVNTGGSAQGGAFGGGAFHPQLHAHLQQQQQQDSASIGGYPDFLSPSSASFPPSSPYTPNGLGGPLSPPIASPRPIIPLALGSSGAGGQQGQGERGNHTTDPNNTTVFVGGLPACISEETLKSFFHHFGEITYCKIPTGKGCGFVQFVRRADAELAIAKMNDFPIHGKSRIRLSWGRSQGDKQVEHVRKLASALGVPFEAVWRMVQGQDGGTIKQIASAVGSGQQGSATTPSGGPHQPQHHQQQMHLHQSNQHQQQGQQNGVGATANSRFESLGVGRMDLGAVASAAGLTEAEVLDLVGGRSSGPSSSSNSTTHNGASHGAAGSDFFARSGSGSSATSLISDQYLQHQQQTLHQPNGAGPYSRVSPSSFSAFSSVGGIAGLPLSPPPSAGAATSSFAINSNNNSYQQQQHSQPQSQSQSPYQHQQSHQQQQQQQQQQYAPHQQQLPSPYTSIRPESYLVHSPTSPYERVDFAEGGRGFTPRFAPAQQQQAYDPYGAGPMQDSFANLGLHAHSTSNSPLPPRSLPLHQQQQQDYYQQEQGYYSQPQQDSSDGAWGGWDGVRA